MVQLHNRKQSFPHYTKMTSPLIRASVRKRYAEAVKGMISSRQPEDVWLHHWQVHLFCEDEHFENLRQHVLENKAEESAIDVLRSSEDSF